MQIMLTSNARIAVQANSSKFQIFQYTGPFPFHFFSKVCSSWSMVLNIYLGTLAILATFMGFIFFDTILF